MFDKIFPVVIAVGFFGFNTAAALTIAENISTGFFITGMSFFAAGIIYALVKRYAKKKK